MKKFLSIVLLFCLLVPCCIADDDFVEAKLLQSLGCTEADCYGSDVGASILAGYMYKEIGLCDDLPIPESMYLNAITSNNAWVGKLNEEFSDVDAICMLINIGSLTGDESGLILPIIIDESNGVWTWKIYENGYEFETEEKKTEIIQLLIPEYYEVNSEYVNRVFEYFDEKDEEIRGLIKEYGIIYDDSTSDDSNSSDQASITINGDFLNNVLPEHSIQECMKNEIRASLLAGYMYYELSAASSTVDNLPIDKETYSDAIANGNVVIGYSNNKICILIFTESTTYPFVMHPIFIDVVDDSWVWSTYEYGIPCNNGNDTIYWINNLLSGQWYTVNEDF